MGPVQAFREGYRDGYGIGFRAGYESLNRGWDDDIYDQSSYGYDGSIGYRTGYQDGISQAREDANKNKPFNPNPRGKL